MRGAGFADGGAGFVRGRAGVMGGAGFVCRARRMVAQREWWQGVSRARQMVVGAGTQGVYGLRARCVVRVRRVCVCELVAADMVEQEGKDVWGGVTSVSTQKIIIIITR